GLVGLAPGVNVFEMSAGLGEQGQLACDAARLVGDLARPDVNSIQPETHGSALRGPRRRLLPVLRDRKAVATAGPRGEGLMMGDYSPPPCEKEARAQGAARILIAVCPAGSHNDRNRATDIPPPQPGGYGDDETRAADDGGLAGRD